VKISELSNLSGTSKETIHHYIRAGLLRKPHKTKGNVASYNQNHLETLMIIKELRDNYYLPLPEIKKALKEIKKNPAAELFSFQFQSRFSKPLDQLFAQEVVGRQAFREVTGIGEKWLTKMEEWGVLAPRQVDGQPLYTKDNVILGKLIVEFDRMGFGPRSGQDPQALGQIADFLKKALLGRQQFQTIETFVKGQLPNSEQLLIMRQYEEIMSLFICNLYKRLFREGLEKYFASHLKNKAVDDDADRSTHTSSKSGRKSPARKMP
jgi:DNA-binding transcriptional MerR regulator